jgi:hypothetical protein
MFFLQAIDFISLGMEVFCGGFLTLSELLDSPLTSRRFLSESISEGKSDNKGSVREERKKHGKQRKKNRLEKGDGVE